MRRTHFARFQILQFIFGTLFYRLSDAPISYGLLVLHELIFMDFRSAKHRIICKVSMIVSVVANSVSMLLISSDENINWPAPINYWHSLELRSTD